MTQSPPQKQNLTKSKTWGLTEVKKMPDTLCRNCGTELHEQSKCSECRQAIQQLCPKCGYATLEQIHTDCTLGLEMVTTNKAMVVQN